MHEYIGWFTNKSDFSEEKWITERWDIRKVELLETEGPAGLRLPYYVEGEREDRQYYDACDFEGEHSGTLL